MGYTLSAPDPIWKNSIFPTMWKWQIYSLESLLCIYYDKRQQILVYFKEKLPPRKKFEIDQMDKCKHFDYVHKTFL